MGVGIEQLIEQQTQFKGLGRAADCREKIAFGPAAD
jgi:hypothetical protein